MTDPKPLRLEGPVEVRLEAANGTFTFTLPTTDLLIEQETAERPDGIGQPGDPLYFPPTIYLSQLWVTLPRTRLATDADGTQITFSGGSDG